MKKQFTLLSNDQLLRAKLSEEASQNIGSLAQDILSDDTQKAKNAAHQLEFLCITSQHSNTVALAGHYVALYNSLNTNGYIEIQSPELTSPPKKPLHRAITISIGLE